MRHGCVIFVCNISANFECKQLNAWLGGYQSILKHMTPGNFNWFLHTMLFYHTKYVLRKQEMKKSEEDEEENLGLDEEAQDNEDN